MIKLVLLTGFLGAGKTTLMKEILPNFIDKKTGVIVNELGSVNIDAVIIKKEGIQMIELSNGSIFCACIKDKFVDSLIEMSACDIDYLFIEASGLADPSNMTQILDGIKNKTLNNYDYKGSICVIDGENFLELYDLLPAIHSQLEFCKAAIINKSDLVEEKQMEDILQKVKDINSEVIPYETYYCRVDIRKIIDGMDNISNEIKNERETSNTYESRPSVFVVKGDQTVRFTDLENFVRQLASQTYRIKGLVKTDMGNIEINSVGENIKLSFWKQEIEKSEIVIISAIGFKLMSSITKAINENVKGILGI